jgi:hypothetical protein
MAQRSAFMTRMDIFQAVRRLLQNVCYGAYRLRPAEDVAPVRMSPDTAAS